MELLPGAQPIARHFHFADSSKRENQLYEIFGRINRSLLYDISNRIGNRCLKRDSTKLHAREIRAHEITRLEQIFHRCQLSMWLSFAGCALAARDLVEPRS